MSHSVKEPRLSCRLSLELFTRWWQGKWDDTRVPGLSVESQWDDAQACDRNLVLEHESTGELRASPSD